MGLTHLRRELHKMVILNEKTNMLEYISESGNSTRKEEVCGNRKEKWVLEKLSNIQGCTPECQSRKPSTLSQHSHAVGSRVASLYRLYSPFCLECSLLLIPCCQNLFHLAGTSLNVHRCEALSCSLYPQGHVFVLPEAWRILLRV